MAAIATQTIEVDLTPGGVSPFLYVSQGDYGTRSLVFNFFLNGQPYSIPSNVTTISLDGITKAGNAFSVPCTFTPGETTATSSLTADMTADIGMDICEIGFKTDVGERLGTANFFIVVEISPLGIKVLYGNVYWSELSKSWAVGGTGLRGDEDENNSKYWANISKYWADSTEDFSDWSKSWAVGGTGKREGEDTDNAMYYASIVNDVRPQLDENTNNISVLESLINQYVVPSTEQPTEVVAARVGFDGTTYDNLGDAVRSQVTVYGYIPGSEEIYFRHNNS